MKRVLVTTCFLNNEEYFQKTFKWINYYLNECKGLEFDKIYLIDNASDEKQIQKMQSYFEGSPIYFVRFSEHYDRPSHLDYKYLWRNVYYMKELLKVSDKIIYMDNDLFLTSKKAVDYVNSLDSGWTTAWCLKHGFPETGIHVLCKGTKKYEDFVDVSWEDFVKKNNNTTMENTLPVTHIEKSLIGNRWSEYGIKEQDLSWDYSAQTELTTKISFYDE